MTSAFRPENPLIVQGDQTVLVEIASARYTQARDALSRFAELVKSPEHIHTYRITPLSIWNATAAGEDVGLSARWTSSRSIRCPSTSAYRFATSRRGTAG